MQQAPGCPLPTGILGEQGETQGWRTVTGSLLTIAIGSAAEESGVILERVAHRPMVGTGPLAPMVLLVVLRPLVAVRPLLVRTWYVTISRSGGRPHSLMALLRKGPCGGRKKI